jgi:hypothetical protein
MTFPFEPDPAELEAGETAAQLLVDHMKRMRAAGIDFRIRDGDCVWIVNVSLERPGGKPN